MLCSDRTDRPATLRGGGGVVFFREWKREGEVRTASGGRLEREINGPGRERKLSRL